MRKLLVVSFSVLVIVALTAVVALAYTGVIGTVVDTYGDPWTYGGTVTCVQNSTGITLGTGTIQSDGTWYVFIGSPSAVTCTIDPAAGPAGDPAPFTCSVPGGGGGGVQDYDCGTASTGTGPNAVSLAGFGAAAMPAGTVALGLAALAGLAAAWKRRR